MGGGAPGVRGIEVKVLESLVAIGAEGEDGGVRMGCYDVG